MSEPLLAIDHLSVRFGNSTVVDDVSFSIAAGEKFALVGESGSGKSITALSVLRLVDAATTVMVQDPRSLDTIVATNLHADVLSDLAGALAGSLGIAPTANLNPEREFPSMFEPIHGSAFDITGKGVANPVATFWTVAMMLEHLGEKPAAGAIMAAIERVCREGRSLPRDIGGTARTTEVTDAVITALG